MLIAGNQWKLERESRERLGSSCEEEEGKGEKTEISSFEERERERGAVEIGVGR